MGIQRRVQAWSRAAWRWLNEHPWLAVALILAGVALYVFAEIAEELLEGTLLPIDLRIVNLLRPYHSPTLDLLAYIFSGILAWPYVLMIIMPFFISMLLRRQWLMALALLIVPYGAIMLVEMLKTLFGRPRPQPEIIPFVYPNLAIGHTAMGFPSGHATMAVVLYGLIAYITWRYYLRRRWTRWLAIAAAIICILATGLSRVYLGVHYPSDVAAGWAAGAFILSGVLILLTVWSHRQEKRIEQMSEM